MKPISPVMPGSEPIEVVLGMSCGWTNVDGSQCGLEANHGGLHDFTIPPPDEFYEENDGDRKAPPTVLG